MGGGGLTQQSLITNQGTVALPVERTHGMLRTTVSHSLLKAHVLRQHLTGGNVAQ